MEPSRRTDRAGDTRSGAASRTVLAQDVELPLDLNPHTWPYARGWPQAFEHSTFEPLQESRFANPHTVDPDGLVAFLGSMGWIDTLPNSERATLLDRVKSRLTASAYRLPFETHVHWTRLGSGAVG